MRTAIFLAEKAGTSGDEDDPVLVVTRRGYLLNVPWLMGGRVSRIYTDDGRFCYNFQGPASGQPDGAGIKYDTHGSLDETTWTAVARIADVPL